MARTTPYCLTSCLALLLGCSAPSSPTGDPRVSSALSTGSLQVLVTGIPEGAAGAVVVTGPGAYRAELPGSTLLNGMQTDMAQFRKDLQRMMKAGNGKKSTQASR